MARCAHPGSHGESRAGAQWRVLAGTPRSLLSPRFLRLSAFTLAALLGFGILTISVPGRSAVSLFEAGLFALAAVWTARLLARPYPLRGSPLLAALILAALWPLTQLAAGTTVYRFETWNAALLWTAYLTAFVLALQVFEDRERLDTFLSALLWFGTLLSAVSLVQLFTSGGRIFWLIPTPYKDLVLGPFVYRNNYAAFIELVIPLALLKALRRRQAALGWTVAAAVMAASVVASGSRAGAILIGLETLAILAFDARGRAGRVILSLAAAAAILIAVSGPGYLLSRFRQADPLTVRREFVESSVAMFRDRPWMGFGLGTWPTAYPVYATFDPGAFANHAHCDWAEWAAEGGLPFLTATVALALAAVFYSTRRRWGIGVVAVFAHALVDYPMQKPALAAVTFTLLGALAASRTRSYPIAQSPGLR